MEPVIGQCAHCKDYVTQSMQPAITADGHLLHRRCVGFFDLIAWEKECVEREIEWREGCVAGPSGTKKAVRHRERQIFEKPRRRKKR